MRVLTLLLILIMVLPLKIMSQSNDSISEVDLSTNPHNILFDLSNTKPGDIIIRELEVGNEGSKDFKYLLSNQFLKGSEKFYNELLLIVSDSKNVLFEGNLKNFEKLEARTLKSGSSEVITFRVEIPYQLGNEFQGLSSEFQFKLYVEGTLGGVLPVDNKLPVTATEIFHYLLIGIVMATLGGILLFYQKRKNREFKSRSIKENIIGP
ncbi:TasA family protein [Sutcliffiella horikoshii]|uniref:TasA family protein n=1 Tax=Sutcliffiella horikoshii TaxID=79883 RepID=UPI00384B5B92